MDAQLSELVEGLRGALRAERTGFEFYRLAAERTEDPAGRATFLRLAEDEKAHFEFLSRHYRSLLEKGRLAEETHLAHVPEAAHAIFSPELKGRLGQAHFEMSALAIAAQLELNGLNHYRALAQRTQLPEARRFFEELAAWEKEHYDAFLRQQQELQEAYWAEAGFAPF